MPISYEEFSQQLRSRLNEFPEMIYSLELMVYGNDFTKLKRSFLKKHSDGVYDACFDDTGEILASASRDKTVQFWRKGDALNFEPVEPPLKFNSYVWSVRFGQYGVATGDADGYIKFWNLGKILSGDKDPLIKELPIGSSNNPVLGVNFSPNDQYIAATNLDNDVKLWWIGRQPELGKTVEEAIDIWGDPVIFRHRETVYDVCCSPDSQYCTSAGLGGSIKYWKIVDGSEQIPRIFTPNAGAVDNFTIYQVSFSHRNGSGTSEDQMVASANGDGTISIWRLSTGELLNTLKHSLTNKPVFGVCFSPDGQKIASAGDDRTIKIWLASNGDWSSVNPKEPFHTYWHGDAVNRVRFSHDGTLLTSGIADGNVGIYQISALEKSGHKDEVEQLLEDSYVALNQFIQRPGSFNNLVNTISKIFNPGR
jgi:WD40 repeat protein